MRACMRHSLSSHHRIPKGSRRVGKWFTYLTERGSACCVVCVRDFCAMMTVKLVGEKETISSAAAAMKSEGLSSIICTPTLFNMVSC